MLLCACCIKHYRIRGFVVVSNDEIYIEQEEAEEFNVTCENCDTIDALYSCDVYKEGGKYYE